MMLRKCITSSVASPRVWKSCTSISASNVAVPLRVPTAFKAATIVFRSFASISSVPTSPISSFSPSSSPSTKYDVMSSRNHTRQRGSVELICGPMFSGKTTELLRRLKRQQLAGKHVILIKHSTDNRYVSPDIPVMSTVSGALLSEAVTHDNIRFTAVPSDSLAAAAQIPEVLSADVVGVDEGQFFSDLAQVADAFASQGKRVVVAALDGTFRQEPFPSTLQLISRAEQVVKLSAVCKVCGYDAPFTVRTTDEAAINVVGGAEKYMALCRECVSDHKSHLDIST